MCDAIRITHPQIASDAIFSLALRKTLTVVSKLITDRHFINFELQIQNRAARRINCHYRDRSVGISQKISHYGYRFSLEFQ